MEVKPGYKMTEVGLIPEDWEPVQLDQVVAVRGLVRGPFGGALKKSFFVDRGYKVYEQRNAIYGTTEKGDYFIDSAKFKELERFQVQPGDLIVSCSGTIGCIYEIPSNAPAGVINQALLKISLNHSLIDPRYFLEIFRSAAFQGRIKENSHGGAMQNLVGMEVFRKAPFQLPPVLAEQEAIAAALSDADALIESLEQLVAKKRQIKHGAMQELLTGKRRLPGFSGKWETKRFDQVFSNLRNASNSRSELAPHGEVAYVHYGDIHIHPTAFLNPVELRTFIPRAKVRAVPRLMDGDLLMADASEDTTAIGKAVEISGLNGAEAIAGLHTMALRGNKEFLADGFKGYIQFMPKVRNALVSLATGVSVYGITKSGVKAIEVTIPKPDEQSAIAAILSDMDAEIAALEAKLAKARQVKQGMMQELLTGKVRLLGNAEEKVA